MKILSIDTSAEIGGITLLENDRIENLRIENTSRVAENIYNLINELLRSADVSLSEIELFLTVLGPGSFTGLRVSLSVLKSFSLVLSKPVIGIETFYVMAYYASQHKMDSENIIVLGDARRGELFCSVYKRDLTELESIRTIRPEEIELFEERYKNVLFVSREQEVLRYLSQSTRFLLLDKDLSYISAAFSLRLFRDGKGVDVSDLEPLYVRNDIVRKNGCF